MVSQLHMQLSFVRGAAGLGFARPPLPPMQPEFLEGGGHIDVHVSGCEVSLSSIVCYGFVTGVLFVLIYCL